jgi:hypothetical protein
MFFNPTRLIIDKFNERLHANYRAMYGSTSSNYPEIITWASCMALEQIAKSDALYHNIEHTIYVTLVGQEILRGKHTLEGGVSPENWLHFTIAALCHDIGYVKGICRQDSLEHGIYATGIDDRVVTLNAGATDAGLTPYHVDRSKRFIDERFGTHALINAEFIKQAIELTRFPAPKDEQYLDTSHFPGLLRAADLIGQLSDPRYLFKMSALFYEFEEIGTNDILGYANPSDLRRGYPDFYWHSVYPLIQTALKHLELTQDGQEIITSLNSQVFQVEHETLKRMVQFKAKQQKVKAKKAANLQEDVSCPAC